MNENTIRAIYENRKPTLTEAIKQAEVDTKQRLLAAYSQLNEAKNIIREIKSEEVLSKIIDSLTELDILVEELPEIDDPMNFYSGFTNKFGIRFPVCDIRAGKKYEIVVLVSAYNIDTNRFKFESGCVYWGSNHETCFNPIYVKLPQSEWTGLPREEDLDEFFNLTDICIKTREQLFWQDTILECTVDEAIGYLKGEIDMWRDVVEKKHYATAFPSNAPASKEKLNGWL